MKTLVQVIAAVCLGAACVSAGEKTAMKISSPDFSDGAAIPARFTCDGADINPALAIEGVPAPAQSLVLIMDDPDAPRGTWNHWLVWNIPPSVGKIAAHSVPAGAVEGRSDFGTAKYGGPCPPSGTHRYYFRLFAIDVNLAIPAGADRKALDKAMSGHVLANGELMGRYSRKP
jgi:Raf kinase inhibitor-like YbhB/YbcL family protein